MLFNSVEFFVFLTAAYIIYWSAPHAARRLVLFLFSLIFYASWSPLFLVHFLLIILINYPFLVQIQKNKSRFALIFVLFLNFLNLAFFKYFYFFVDSVNYFAHSPLLASINPQNDDIIPAIILPLAISFYTFQITALQVDVYRNEMKEAPSLFNFSLFITFFPQLIAGPIMRQDQLFPQLEMEKKPDDIDITRGLALIGTGLVKKVFIADLLAAVSKTVSQSPGDYHAISLLFSAYFFLIMVYCDFSGYTDFARGAALLFGFEIPANFRGPLFQISYSDHWNRWHITLSTWLRDYLYIALGGNRQGATRAYFNLFLTFFLGGLWHGAGWGFAIWGTLNGLYVAIERYIYKGTNLIKTPASWGRREDESDKSYRKRTAYNVFKAILIFNSIAMAAIFFNTGLDVSRGVRIFLGIFTNWDPELKVFPLNTYHGLMLLLFLFLHYLEYNDYFRKQNWETLARQYSSKLMPAVAVLLLFYCSWKAGGDTFVYFQF